MVMMLELIVNRIQAAEGRAACQGGKEKQDREQPEAHERGR